jgi:hypothetical protein
MSQEEIEDMAHMIDEFFYELMIENEISTSVLSGIILARLNRICEEANESENFYKLLKVVSKREHEDRKFMH